MSIFSKKNGKNPLPLSFYIKIFSFFAIIGVSAIVMMPLQDAISRAMYNVRNDFIGRLENFTGTKIYYSSIRPTIFGSIDIRNLKFMNGEAQILTVSRIRLNFSVLELILQKRIFIHTVQIERPVLNIDTQRDSETLEFLSSLIKNGSNEQHRPDTQKITLTQISEILPRNANYRIRQGSFHFSGANSQYSLDEINFNIKEEDQYIVLDGSITAEFIYSALANKTLMLGTKIGINSVSANDLKTGKADIAFSYITISQRNEGNKNESFFRPAVSRGRPVLLFSVLPFNISASFKDNELYSIKPKDNKAAYNIRYNTEREFLFADLNFDDFILSDIISVSDFFSDKKHLFDIPIKGSAAFSYDQTTKSFSYNLNLKGGNIDVPSFPLNDAFSLILAGDQGKVDITDLRISASAATAKAGLFQGSAGVSGEIVFAPLKYNGTVFLDRISLSKGEAISAVFEASNIGDRIQVTSGEIKIAQAAIYDFIAFLHPSQKDTGINISCHSINGGELFLDAVYNYYPRELEASLTLVSLSLFDLMEFVRPFANIIDIPFGRSFLSGSLVSADFFISTDFNNIFYNAPNIVFNLGATRGVVSVSGTDHQFTLSEGLINLYDNELNISANMVFSNPLDLSFQINAAYLDIAWQVEGQIIDRNTLIIHEPNGLHAYGNISNTGAMSGYIEGINFPVPFAAQALYLNFYTALRYDSPDFWNLDFNDFFAVYNSEEVFRASGYADQNGAKFNNIQYIDSEGTLTADAEFFWNVGFSDIRLTFFASDGDEEGENYYLTGQYKDNKIDIKASFSDMHLSRFTKANDLIVVNADVQVSWDSINQFNAQLDLFSFDAYIQGAPVSASVSVYMSDNILLVNRLNFEYLTMSAYVQELHFNRLDGFGNMQMNMKGVIMNNLMESEIKLNTNFNKIDSWMDFRKILNKFNGTLAFENIKYGDYSADQISFDFSADNGAFLAAGGIGEMLRLDMDKDGYFFLGLSAPFPIKGVITGTYNNKGIIDATSNNFFIDMELLYNLVSSSTGFDITGGYITGQMNLRGPFWNPEFYGYGNATSMQFYSADYVSNVIRAVPFRVTAEGHEMTFENVVIGSGSGSAVIDGWLHFLNWSPVSIGLNINIPRDTPVPYGFNIAGFIASGNASGNLELLFETRDNFLELSGKLFTNTAQLGLNTDTMAANSDLQINSIVDLTITTGSAVEFVWPTSNPIIRANPEMGTLISVYSDTKSGVFSLDSDVNIKSGEFYYFNRSFYIRQGNIIFRESESKFDPIISARAEIRERADSGAVTISMVVENKPLLRFEPVFTASPSLTQLEIYTILGQNLGSVQGDENTDMQRFLISSTTDILAQIVSSSESLSQLMFLRQLEQQVRNTLRLDMFSIRTRFIQNAFVSGITGAQSGVFDRNVGISNFFDNTTVFIGKYIGRDMFIQGMLTLRYDENNRAFGGIVFEPDIGIELQSPFINIRWDFFPYHPENWWVSDNSITISWRKSF
ncbi:MAG: translocation/assembly module TamB [Treponema sp.]|nr:translocation/assembly module TamB [Treponema sp.]